MLRLTRSNGSRGSALPLGRLAQPANKKNAAKAALMALILIGPFYIVTARRHATRAARASIRGFHRAGRESAGVAPRSGWAKREPAPAAGWRAAGHRC